MFAHGALLFDEDGAWYAPYKRCMACKGTYRAPLNLVCESVVMAA